MKAKMLRKLANVEFISDLVQDLIEFDVMHGSLTDFRGSHTNHSVVGVGLFPSTSVQGQLKGLKHATGVPQAHAICFGAVDGFQIANDDQPLNRALHAVEWEGRVVGSITQHTCIDQTRPLPLGEVHLIDSVSKPGHQEP